jgi:hypothetical protein
MTDIGLICEAEIPEGMFVEVKVRQDVDGDGEYENTRVQPLKDGKYIYRLEGFQGDQGNQYSTEINLGRDRDVSLSPTRDNPQPPSVKAPELILIGPPESNETDPREVLSKFQEAHFFLTEMKSAGMKNHQYYLSAFLGALYSIDDLLKQRWKTWEEWTDSEASADLHDYMMDNRHDAVHLTRSTRGPSQAVSGQSINWEFGGSDEPSRIENSYIFTAVPKSVLKQYVREEDLIPIAEVDSTIGDSPATRILPSIPLCDFYLGLVKERISDWARDLDEDTLSVLDDDVVNLIT